MVSLASKAELGVGLYTPVQAACLARIPASTMTRWVLGSSRGRSAVRAQIAPDGEKTVTFLDLVQAMAVRAIRRTRKVPLAKIRAFVERAEDRHGIRFPFAREHVTYLFHDDIVLRVGDRLVQMTGKYRDQDLIRPVVEPYLHDLSFTDGLASSYRPLREEDRWILIDPARRMGHPLVMPCGLSVAAILDAVATEGTPEAAARCHEIELADVLLAQKYDDLMAGVVS